MSNEQISDGELRGLETLCAALHAATESDPAVKDVAWRTFALIRAHREQVAEARQLKTELEPFQILTHQACPKKEHADWFVDSEHNHLCPWCRIAERDAEVERLKAERDRNQRTLQKIRDLSQEAIDDGYPTRVHAQILSVIDSAAFREVQ